MTPLEQKVIKNTGKFVEEFKEFAIKGNVLDLAVAVVVGAAGGRVVTSLVTDLMTPPVSLLLGKVNFADLFLVLSGGSYKTLVEAKSAGAITLNYGQFASNILDFLLVTFVIFLAVRSINRLRRQSPTSPHSKECPRCLSSVKKAATRCAYCTTDLV